MTVRVFCLLKIVSNAHRLIILGTKMIFSGDVAQPPLPHLVPPIEILNTRLLAAIEWRVNIQFAQVGRVSWTLSVYVYSLTAAAAVLT